MMSRVLSCPEGHRWEEADDRASTASAARCPICGQAADTDEPRTNPSPSNTPTVMHEPSWQPLPPLGAETPPAIPDFEILGELGRGGMGVVYKARQRNDGRIVALKVIRKERLLDDEAVRRFRREAQAAARASHPNIVRVLDSDRAGDTHYLVMEYVDGVTLQRLVDAGGPLPVAQACDFICQAAEGLQHAREQALVHRDIKPSNLMVAPPTPKPQGESASPGGQNPPGSQPRPGASIVKILDLGVARLLPPGGSAPGDSLSTLTQSGSVIGTADYIAPEQLEDPHRADIRADLYSLGCTFYFLLTGRVPFPGGSLISKLDKQRWQTPEPIEAIRSDTPAAVVSVVQKLMAKRPADRYQSPGELARVLRAMAHVGYHGPDAAALLTLRSRLRGHTDAVWSACFAPADQQIVSGGKDRNVLLWDVASGAQVRALPMHAQEVRAVAFAGADRIVSASGLTLRLWDTAAAKELRRCSGHTGAVRSVIACVDDQRLLSGGEDRTIRLWDMHAGREVARYTRHTAGVTCLACVPQSSHVLSGSRDQTVRLWELPGGHDIAVLAPGAGAVLAVAASPDGRLAASAHFDTIIRLWDLQTGTALRRCEGHRQMITSLAFTRDGRWLISGSQDQTVRLWDVETACELSCVPGHMGGINAVDVSPDGRQALVAGNDGTIYIYEVAS